MKSFKKLYATMKESIDFVDLFSHNSAQRALGHSKGTREAIRENSESPWALEAQGQSST